MSTTTRTPTFETTSKGTPSWLRSGEIADTSGFQRLSVKVYNPRNFFVSVYETAVLAKSGKRTSKETYINLPRDEAIKLRDFLSAQIAAGEPQS